MKLTDLFPIGFCSQRFTQFLASSNCTFQLSNFLDKANPQGESVQFILCYVSSYWFPKFYNSSQHLDKRQ